jgi:16S rRNA (guanine527-N7)-methyltransferase
MLTPLPEQFIHKFRRHLEKSLKTNEIKLSERQMNQMAGHAEELLTWNQKMNLTAIKDPLEVAEKHFFDSIAVASFLDNETSLADIGSGGGFPGIPLKIMKPELNLLLIDASRKKINFLKHVIRRLKLENIEAVHARVETLNSDPSFFKRFDAVISRAFTDLGRFVDLSLPLLHPGGRIYAMKGKHLDMEITPDLAGRFECKTHHYQLPFEKADRYVIRLSAKQGY